MERPAKKRKKAGHGQHMSEWEKTYFGVVRSSDKGKENSLCVPCGSQIKVKVAASGHYDLKQLFETAVHKQSCIDSFETVQACEPTFPETRQPPSNGRRCDTSQCHETITTVNLLATAKSATATYNKCHA
ncbi:hypothetical protein V1264_006676 [Littorina saxatilis]|uniref:Uncharacterized protein n=1 Tax=Littorina saxatilis TaxID=31220 RepID=A0AAN9AXN7_9CAEN